MSNPIQPDTPPADEPDVPGPLPELPSLDPSELPETEDPAGAPSPPEDVPFVPPPGTQ